VAHRPQTLTKENTVSAAADTVFSERELDILATYRIPRPAEWELSSPALLVVDVVESFVGPDVPVTEAQNECVTACGENAWRAVERIGPLLESFRRRGLPVAFSTIGSLPLRPGGRPRRAPSALRADVVIEPLAPVEGELEFAKITPSAFFGTPLMSWLTARRVDQVVVVGGATSGCVRATALDAYSYGLDVLIPEDGCFDRVRTSHVASLTDIDTKYGRVVQSVEVLERLGHQAVSAAGHGTGAAREAAADA
jgi:nicotinamidase-related amidase